MLYRSVFERYLVNDDKFPVNLGALNRSRKKRVKGENYLKVSAQFDQSRSSVLLMNMHLIKET